MTIEQLEKEIKVEKEWLEEEEELNKKRLNGLTTNEFRAEVYPIGSYHRYNGNVYQVIDYPHDGMVEYKWVSFWNRFNNRLDRLLKPRYHIRKYGFFVYLFGRKGGRFGITSIMDSNSEHFKEEE